MWTRLPSLLCVTLDKFHFSWLNKTMSTVSVFVFPGYVKHLRLLLLCSEVSLFCLTYITMWSSSAFSVSLGTCWSDRYRNVFDLRERQTRLDLRERRDRLLRRLLAERGILFAEAWGAKNFSPAYVSKARLPKENATPQVAPLPAPLQAEPPLHPPHAPQRVEHVSIGRVLPKWENWRKNNGSNREF